jgi:hypothetical protein
MLCAQQMRTSNQHCLPKQEEKLKPKGECLSWRDAFTQGDCVVSHDGGSAHMTRRVVLPLWLLMRRMTMNDKNKELGQQRPALICPSAVISWTWIIL